MAETMTGTKAREIAATIGATVKPANVSRTTVKVYQLVRDRSVYMHECGEFLSFSPCADYNSKRINETCYEMVGDLSDNFSLVTLPVWDGYEDTPAQLTFAVHNDDKAKVPAYLVTANGCLYDPETQQPIEFLRDAGDCTPLRILTNVRSA